MSRTVEVAVVVASIGPSRAPEACVRGFLAEVGDRGEVILATAGRDPRAERLAELGPRVRRLQCAAGSLAPELWRDGLNASESRLVAFSTGQMVPRPGWLAAMRAALDASDAAGVGGPIAPGPGLTRGDRALYLLRYAAYLPPVPESEGFDPPGDNALYRRDRLSGLDDSWRDGFWEIEVHRRLRLRGERLAAAPSGVIDFLGGGSFASAIGHRLRHAHRFGAGRSRGLGPVARLRRAAIAPAVPPLLLARIVKNLTRRGQPLGPWLAALPSLGLLLAAWAGGEAAGALRGGREPAEAIPTPGATPARA